MLFDIGWPELMLIGMIALVVIGPKDLPRALRVAGFWLRKARSLSREFQSSVDQMIREAELDEVRDELKKASEFNIADEFHRTIDPDGSLAESVQAPDYFTPAPTAAAPPLPPPDNIAPEAPIAPDMPEPDFVGFEAAEPAAEISQYASPAAQIPAPRGEPVAAKP